MHAVLSVVFCFILGFFNGIFVKTRMHNYIFFVVHIVVIVTKETMTLVDLYSFKSSSYKNINGDGETNATCQKDWIPVYDEPYNALFEDTLLRWQVICFRFATLFFATPVNVFAKRAQIRHDRTPKLDFICHSVENCFVGVSFLCCAFVFLPIAGSIVLLVIIRIGTSTCNEQACWKPSGFNISDVSLFLTKLFGVFHSWYQFSFEFEFDSANIFALEITISVILSITETIINLADAVNNSIRENSQRYVTIS